MERLTQAIAQLGAGGYIPGSSATRGYVYNPIPFPGCEGVPCHRPNSGERWRMIEKSTSFSDKVVLDYGCATGYFSFKTAQAGAASVTGVDYDDAALNVCREIVKHFKVRNVAFFHAREFILKGNYDVAFALSVLNWLGQDKAEYFCEWLSSHVGVTWVEIPLKGDGRGGASWLESDADAVTWLLQYFTNVITRGSTRGPHRGKKRTLFKCG